MVSVKIKDNENIERALRRFKKKCDKAGVSKEFRTRTQFTKPSVKRRMQVIKARYRQHKQMESQGLT